MKEMRKFDNFRDFMNNRMGKNGFIAYTILMMIPLLNIVIFILYVVTYYTQDEKGKGFLEK